MAFSDDLYTFLSGDSSLNNWANGGLYYLGVPVNADESYNYIVYNYNERNDLNSLDTVAHTSIYNLEVQLISTDVISWPYNIYKDYILNYDSGNIRNIELSDTEINNYDSERDMFYTTMIFDLTYTN
jgi:hypothetical protein